MTDEQWQTAWKLHQSGSSIPPERISAFLDSVTSDPQVRDSVLAMFERSPSETLDRIGQKIGRYVLTGRLGEGGMGEVYAARDLELGRSVAVKLLTRSPPGTSSPVDRFIREAKAASALNHPNIVTIYEVIHSESRLAIVMELGGRNGASPVMRLSPAGGSSVAFGRAGSARAGRRSRPRHRSLRHQA
jgi:serine/threonine protein kinase